MLSRYCVIAILCVVFLSVNGCATQSRYYSSTVDFLYPDKTDPIEKPEIPVMHIPIKVGIAFVPTVTEHPRYGSFWQGFTGRAGPQSMALTEIQKSEIMKQVVAHFKKYSFIGSIEIIPSSYLKPKGSFANLDQIRTMYGVDAIALLAFDQVQFTDEGTASFLYWTVIGAYVVPGEKNSTQTMMDAVVYDIKSRKLLFRAPGISDVKGNATPVNLSEELRQDSQTGFELASKDLIKNLDEQLTVFKDKIKESPSEYKIVERPGYHSGGNFNLWFIALLVILKSAALFRRKIF